METPSDAGDAGRAAEGPTLLRQYLAVLSVGGSCFVIIATEYLPVGLIPAMTKDLGISVGTAGLTMTLPALVAACSTLAVDVLVERLDRRTVLIGLIALLGAANLISFLAPAFPVLLASRVLVGTALGGFWPLGISIGARLMPESTGARGTTIIFSGLSIGTIAGVPAGTLVAESFGWQAAFGAAALVSAVSVATLTAFLPWTLPLRLARWRDLGALLSIPQARLGLVLALMTFGSTFYAYPYIAPFLGMVARMSPEGISAMLVLFGISGLVGNLLGGWLDTRSNRLAMVLNALGLAVPVFLLAWFGTIGVVAILVVGVRGLVYGALSIVCQSWVARAAPEALETAGALYVAIVQGSVSLGAWLGGMIVDDYGVASVMTVSGVVALAAAALVPVFGGPSYRPTK